MTKLPFILPDSFFDWENVSVARAICYTNLQGIAQHLDNRDNFDPEFTAVEITKIQQYLYNDCLTADEKQKLSFEEFIDEQVKKDAE